MLGDDPDPTVTTVRLGFGEVFGRMPEGVGGCAERVKRSDKRESKIRLDSEWSMNARGDAATTSGCKFYENKCG